MNREIRVGLWQRLVQSRESRSFAGLSPLGMRKIKGLSARLKSCPDTNRAEIDFLSNLF